MIPHDANCNFLAVDHDPDGELAELSPDELPWPLRRERRPHVSFVEWLRREPDLLGRAGYATAVRCAVSREDADDAVQEAITRAWARGLKLRGSAEALMWLRREARRVLVESRRARCGDDEAWGDAPSGWTANAMIAAIDADAFAARATTTAGARSVDLLRCLAETQTLDDAGRRLGGLTRERVRQCRDALVVSLRRWAIGPRWKDRHV